jgi:hypothetical protein
MNSATQDSGNDPFDLPDPSRSNKLRPEWGEGQLGNCYAFFDKPSLENLAANRLGHLTVQQRSAIERQLAYHRSSALLIAGMIACVALAVFFLFWMVDREDGILSYTNLLISGSIVTLFLVLLAGRLAGDVVLLFVKDDLERVGVASAVGNVEWKGNRYRMVTASRQLRSLRRGVVLPPPDNYRFYFLPRTGLVVMTEKVTDLSQEESDSVLLRILAQANQFSLEDLEQNHTGRLSENQSKHLMFVLAFYAFLVLSGVFLALSVLFRMSGRNPSGLPILLLLFAVLFVSRLGLSVVQMVADLWSGEVSSLEGPVTRQTRRSRYSRSYYYAAGLHKFQISQAAYNALIEGKSYRIYYVPRSQRLVSIEPL